MWWLDRGVDGFRMDVINFISKTEGLPDAPAIPGQRFVIAFDGFVDGPHVHDYLAEMTREVFGGRDGEFITVGEMPGVTPEQARLYTDPARGELNMVFQFEHVSVDQSPTNKFDYLGLDLVVLKRALHRWQARWRRPVGTACTGTTTTSLAWCPGSATTTPITGPPRRKHSQPFCTACAAPRSSIKARNSE